MKIKNLFFMLSFLSSFACHDVMARTEEDSINELGKAANTALSTYQSAGTAGLIQKTTECYEGKNNSLNYCFYLDYSSRILDAQASAVEHFPSAEFFSDEKFGPRVSATLPKLGVDEHDYNEYLQKVATAIRQVINKKANQSNLEPRKQAHADSEAPNYVKKGSTVCLNADTILAQAMAASLTKNAGIGAGDFSTPDDCLVVGRDTKIEIEQKTMMPQVTRVLLDGINKYVFVSTNDLRNHAPVEEIANSFDKLGDRLGIRKQSPSNEEKPNTPPPVIRHDANYGPKVHACIQPGFAYPTPPRTGTTNPTVEYQVQLSPDGRVQGVSLVRASGNAAFDAAVGRAIQRCNPFPKPSIGGYEPSVVIDYGMYE